MSCYSSRVSSLVVYRRYVSCALQWRQNGRQNHQPHDCLPNHLFRRRSSETSKFRVTGLCAGISPRPVNSTAQMASDAGNVSTWWRHHGIGVQVSEWNSLSPCKEAMNDIPLYCGILKCMGLLNRLVLQLSFVLHFKTIFAHPYHDSVASRVSVPHYLDIKKNKCAKWDQYTFVARLLPGLVPRDEYHEVVVANNDGWLMSKGMYLTALNMIPNYNAYSS